MFAALSMIMDSISWETAAALDQDSLLLESDSCATVSTIRYP
jgi:hypothetical protein